MRYALTTGLLHPFSCYLQNYGVKYYSILPKTDLRLRLSYLFLKSILLFEKLLEDRDPVLNVVSSQYLARSSVHVVGAQKVCAERRIWTLKSKLQGIEAPEGAHEPAHPRVPRAQAGPQAWVRPSRTGGEGAREDPSPPFAPPPPQSHAARSCTVLNDDSTSCFWAPRLRLRLC